MGLVVETGLLAHLPKVPDRMPPGKGVMALGSSPAIANGRSCWRMVSLRSQVLLAEKEERSFTTISVPRISLEHEPGDRETSHDRGVRPARNH